MPRRPPAAARRIGYVVVVVIDALVLYAIHAWPGWDAVPFLTADTELVLPIVTASLVAGIVANLAFVVADPPRFKAFGDLVTTAIALAATVRVWQVFPFDFGEGFDWALVARVFLVLGIVGSLLGMAVQLTTIVRGRPFDEHRAETGATREQTQFPPVEPDREHGHDASRERQGHGPSV